jgi:hypothetical protein
LGISKKGKAWSKNSEYGQDKKGARGTDFAMEFSTQLYILGRAFAIATPLALFEAFVTWYCLSCFLFYGPYTALNWSFSIAANFVSCLIAALFLFMTNRSRSEVVFYTLLELTIYILVKYAVHFTNRIMCFPPGCTEGLGNCFSEACPHSAKQPLIQELANSALTSWNILKTDFIAFIFMFACFDIVNYDAKKSRKRHNSQE